MLHFLIGLLATSAIIVLPFSIGWIVTHLMGDNPNDDTFSDLWIKGIFAIIVVEVLCYVMVMLGAVISHIIGIR